MNLFTAWTMIGAVAILSLATLIVPGREGREILAMLTANFAFAVVLLAVLL